MEIEYIGQSIQESINSQQCYTIKMKGEQVQACAVGNCPTCANVIKFMYVIDGQQGKIYGLLTEYNFIA